MIYTELTLKAMNIAYNAHHGQLDKGGVPYILHPVHLAEEMTDEISTCVALLHDVVEDTPVTLEDLADQFPPAVIEALEVITHKDGEPYGDYVRRVKENPIAKAVKLADLRHNSDLSRIKHTSPEVQAYFRKKYENAFEILGE